MGRITSLHKKDNGYSGITCTIYYQEIYNALCDLGVSVNLMPKARFEELGYLTISPTTMTIQLADSSIKYQVGIVESLLVNVRGSYVLQISWSLTHKKKFRSFSGDHS
jgi:hypothetical protein